ncbi:YdeI/OmpD-associated family protein [Geosporobacter ferrireducens]|uniref:Thymidylate synthase n=1 Tax=Geosporobacter ferrireducens TaxID=1424294 RepID=A0A1D8GEY7_9FIRM|nr:YdeI/OmpD-associated family protein [Geosporobacter ferrireducens]AOT69475.1 thymidylate synthase [Geosporobacter ferrireducens]
MDMENILNVTTREALRLWLQDNCNIEKCCWVIVSISPKQDTLLYLDAVEEALCFGWIDSVRKKNSKNQLVQRLSPRAKKSSWTELNKERVRRLEKLGLMTDAGRKVLPDMRSDAFIIDEIIVKRLKEDDQTFENFMKFPELYRRIRIDTIHQVKNQPELFIKRLDKFIDHTKQGKMYGAWNDNGRLSEY